MTLKKVFLLIFTLVFFESFAIFIVNAFRPTTPLNGGGFIDDYINFPTLDCVFEPELTRDFSIQKTAQSLNKNAASFGTPIVGDITGDGIPEVLILQNPGDDWGTPNLAKGDELIYKTKNIVIYNYDGSNLALTSVLTTPFFINMEGPNPFLISRIPGFINPLIIVAASSSEPSAAYKSRLVAYEFSGGVFLERWVSLDTYGMNVPFGNNFPIVNGILTPYQYSSGGAPGIADFDQDGTPEVYIFNEIFDATSGAKLADGGNFGQGVSQVKTIGYDMNGGSISLTVAADLTSNPGLELAAGNTVYNVTNTAGTWSMTPIQAGFNVNGSAARDGFTSIADINNDGRLDVVVTTARQRTVANSRTVYAWTVDLANNPVLIASNTIPDSPLSSPLGNQYEAGTGVAFIGDIDGDLAPEIGVTSHKYLTMFEYNGSPMLQIRPGYPQVTNDRSGYTLITMFDFNQDGNQELVYRDERELRIIDGVTGGDLATFPVYSATAGEGAIVADLDSDGQAEIVVTDSETFPIGDFPPDPGAYLTVYETASDPWAPARPIWNQYGYFNVNILGDLSVPQNQLNHAIRAGDSIVDGVVVQGLFPNLDPVNGCFPPNAQPLNSFLVQGTFYNDSGCRTANIPAFDVEIDNSSLFARRTCDPTVLEINFSLRNNFTAQDIPADMKISFYKEEADGTLTFLNAIIDAGQIITQADGWVQFNEVITSNLIPATGVFKLVIIANNTGTVDSPDRLLECNYNNNTSIAIPVVDLPTYTIASSSDVLCAPGNQLILTPVSSNSLAVNPEKKWQRINLAGFPDFEIFDGATDPNLPGVTYEINASEELIINNLPPGDFSFVFDFVGCDLIETVTEFSVEVSLVPSPAFDKVDVGCFGESSGQILLLSTDLEPGINYTLLDENQNPVTGYSPVSSALVGDILFDNLPIGIYSIAYFNEANTTCSGLSPPIEIIQPDPFIVQNISNESTTCGIPDNGSIELTLSGGTSPYTLTSISRDGNLLTGFVPGISGTTYTFTGLEAGNYEIIFTDAEGCLVTELETVGTIPPPDILLSANPAYCENEQITITTSIVEAGTLDATVVYT
ncbi:MAG: VCBS repeat-containing protein, partial [Algoriphagus sp.]|uniref:FG-GAP repeat domain-containing protein n=1 Tax=Algoriphagus sp. TaxID=1872435 RepID=UPI002634491D